jgi:hypothetical protein
MSRFTTAACFLSLFLVGNTVWAGSITGSPILDGWTFGGNSLANGVYVGGTANYGFDTYSTVISVQAGSNLAISDGANSWLAGDTVLGVGGRFVNITAADAGWSAFTGNAVNRLLGIDGAALKLQAKFGTDLATFSASTLAPVAGNGLGSLGSNGGLGAVQIRTSAWFYAPDWSAASGILQLLDKSSHIERNGATTTDADVARLMWIWDTDHVDTWEILLNTSLLARLYPGLLAPAAGDAVIMTVQNRDSSYTNALVTTEAVVPEPATLSLALLGGLGLALAWQRRKQAR